MAAKTNTNSVSPQILAALVDNAPDFILLIDRDRRIVYVNHTIPTMTVEQALGQSVDNFIAPADQQKVTAAIDTVFRTRQSTSYESTGPDDGYYFVRVGWVPVESGPELVSLIVTEVTETKRAQETMHSERRFFEAMHRINRIIVDSTTIDSMLEDSLQEMLDIFDCERVWLLHPCDPDAPSWRVEMERTRPKWPGAAEQKVAIPASDFSRFAFTTALSSEGVHVFDPSHNPLDPDEPISKAFGIRSQMLMAIRPRSGESWCLGLHNCEQARTYTWEREVFEAIGRRLADGLTSLLMQRNMKQSEERLRALVEHAPDAIVTLDLDTRKFAHANARACELFGYEPAEFLDIGVVALSPELQPCAGPSSRLIQQYLDEALAGAIPEFEWTHLDSRGQHIPCEVRLVLLPSKDRRLVRGSITDIRARKAAEQERHRLEAKLVQAQKMESIGQLTGGVAHDFNNLLTVILGNITLLSRQLDKTDPRMKWVDGVSAATRRAATLTQRLLAFSRKQQLKPEILELNQLVSGMEEMLRRTLGETIKVVVIGAVDLWKCEADPSQVENAVLNLAINARDAMPDGGTLTLQTVNAHIDDDHASEQEAVEPGHYVQLTVTDTGTGMSQDVLARVFEPFFTTKQEGRGSGLGLSMVFGFVKQSGGHVQLDSALGNGTMVKVYLPQAAPSSEVTRTQGRIATEPIGHGETIIVVEDEKAVRELVVRLLERLGYSVLAAVDAATALETLKANQPVDLLFTDVVLPGGMNGAELARAARAVQQDLRVLFTSGYPADALSHKGRLDPGVKLLDKPYTPNTLSRYIADALKANALKADSQKPDS